MNFTIGEIFPLDKESKSNARFFIELVLKEPAMKSLKIISWLFVLFIPAAPAAYAQQQFTHTVTAKNKYCNATCSVMDVPELNDNPLAVILVTPLTENSRNLNTHPVGVYYVPFLKKWSVINTDATAIAEGAIFDIQYYPKPNSNQFVYVVPQKKGSIACIDHPGLNANPNAQIRFSATGSPRGAYFNGDEIKIEYDASALKWCLTNVNNNPMPSDVAYNIVITSDTPVVSKASKPTTPLAPLIVVAREEWEVPKGGKNAYGVMPQECRKLTPGYENPAILITDSVIITHQVLPGDGEWLRWIGTIKNGSVLITVCNTKTGSPSGFGDIHIGGMRVNILVLR